MSSPTSTTVPLERAGASARPTAAAAVDEWSIVSVTALGHMLCHAAELVFSGVLLAVMAEFALQPEQAAALALLGYVLMGVGALPVGVWTDAWGPGRVLWLYFLLLAAACCTVAMASSLWMLFVALTLLGLATSIYHPAGLALLSIGVRARGRALGIHGVAGSVGLALGPMLGLFASALGHWRLAYLAVAALSLLAALWMRGPLNIGGEEARRDCEEPAPADSQTSWTPLVLMMLAMTVAGFNYRCVVTALPAFLSDGSDTSSDLIKGGVFVTLAMIAGGVGQFLGGWSADAWGSRKVYFALIALFAPAVFVLGSLEGSGLVVYVACLVAFCQFAQQPVENCLLAEYTSHRRRGLSYAAKFALTFGVGAVGVLAVGYLWEEYSLGSVFKVVAGTSLLMAVILARAVLPGRVR